MEQTKVFAPGRVEVLGNHTDYNAGVVLSAALELGVEASARRLPGGRVELQSEGMGGVERFDRAAGFARSGRWTDYPLGVAEMLGQAGAEAGGFSISFQSTLPSGAGLSSSAALEVATAVALLRLYPWPMGRMDVARLCRRAENSFVGVNCGLLDQASSVFGRRDHLVFLDCRSEAVEVVPFPEGLGLLVVDSGVKHALTGGEYNERRDRCFEAARRMGVAALRDATGEQLEAAAMPELAKRRARHVVGENERVFLAVEALRNGDARALGGLMVESHRSSIENFENSTEEQDALVDLAVSQDGCLGARLTGGGFGGAIVALVGEASAQRVLQDVISGYLERTGNRARGFFCRPWDGALPDGPG